MFWNDAVDVELALKEWGLTDKEIAVYVTLLPLGNVNLQEVARRVDFPRTTVYNTLHYLVQKGLVSTITKNRIMYFEAVDPKKFLDTLEHRKKLVESVLPELAALKNLHTDTSSVEIYQGTNGLFTILSDVLSVQQPTYYFGSYTRSLERLRHLPEHFRRLRLERKIRARIVIDPYDEPLFHAKEYRKITEMRFLPELKDFPCMIFIYGKKVAIYTVQGELVGMIIKNEQTAMAMKMIFELYWSRGKPATL